MRIDEFEALVSLVNRKLKSGSLINYPTLVHDLLSGIRYHERRAEGAIDYSNQDYWYIIMQVRRSHQGR